MIEERGSQKLIIKHISLYIGAQYQRHSPFKRHGPAAAAAATATAAFSVHHPEPPTGPPRDKGPWLRARQAANQHSFDLQPTGEFAPLVEDFARRYFTSRLIVNAERICRATAPHRGGEEDATLGGVPGAAEAAALQAGREGPQEDQEKD